MSNIIPKKIKCLCGCGQYLRPNFIREQVKSDTSVFRVSDGKVIGISGYGYMNNNKFNTLRCGFRWAVRNEKNKWNELVKLIQKINNLWHHYAITTNGLTIFITGLSSKVLVSSRKTRSAKQNTWQTIVDFLKLYNDKKFTSTKLL